MSEIDRNSLYERHRDLGIEIEETIPGEWRVSVDGPNASALLLRLRDDEETAMRQLVDLTAIDRGEDIGRFEVVYRLRAIEGGARLRVHARVDSQREELDVSSTDRVDSGGSDSSASTEMPFIDSVVSIWPSADWLEREVFDLFGIRFRGHPSLRRILLDEAFSGAPLRKDSVSGSAGSARAGRER
jgi:NADH-quinone oxidoreductase subunit C